jgi:hypothetical protein
MNLCRMTEKRKLILDAEEQFEFDVKNIMFIYCFKLLLEYTLINYIY